MKTLKGISVLNESFSRFFQESAEVRFEVGIVGYSQDENNTSLVESSKTKVIAFVSQAFDNDLLWEIKNWVYEEFRINFSNSDVFVRFNCSPTSHGKWMHDRSR